MTMTADREPLVLEENLHRLIRDYEQRVHEFEGRYEMNTRRPSGRTRCRSFRETAEVAEWVITWRTLEALRREVTASPVA